MAHTVRSIGNAVGLPAGRTTNRKNPKYLRKKNRIARRLGFDSDLHMGVFHMLVTKKMDELKAQAAQQEGA